MGELDRLAASLEAEELTNENIEQIITMVRANLSRYDAGARVKTEEAEGANIWDVVKVEQPKVKLVRRKI